MKSSLNFNDNLEKLIKILEEAYENSENIAENFTKYVFMKIF